MLHDVWLVINLIKHMKKIRIQKWDYLLKDD